MRSWMPAIATALGASSASGQQPAPLARPEATFANDAAFLAEHADVVLLNARSTDARSSRPRGPESWRSRRS